LILIPSVIDVTTNYLEHPEVVANRICAAVAAMGERERVIGGTDCGFGTFASYEFIAEDVVWRSSRRFRMAQSSRPSGFWVGHNRAVRTTRRSKRRTTTRLRQMSPTP
jgi:hypothetical protein